MNTAINAGEDLNVILSQKIDEVLKPLIPRGTACALIDFPNYSNPGDSAIWLGERKWLRKNKNPIVYSCNIETYLPDILAEQLGDGIILINGGGNFGDLWEAHQYFRERVVQDFPKNEIIQFPQTIFFEKEASLARTRKILNAHFRFTILCRDKQSVEFAEKEFTARSILCPDMAFALEAIERPYFPQKKIVWLSRTDKESIINLIPIDEPDIQLTDWLKEPLTKINEKIDFIHKELKILPENWLSLYNSLSENYDLIALQRVHRGCSLLTNGRVVITDRLHAHIFCLLMGIPHVLMDNNYGKVKGFYDTWTYNNKLTIWALSTEDVIDNIFANPQFQRLIATKEDHQSSLDKLVDRLKGSLQLKIDVESRLDNEEKLWLHQIHKIRCDLSEIIPKGEKIILVDEDQVRGHLNLYNNPIFPFMEHGQKYFGPPLDNSTAIKELQRLQALGAGFIAIALTAFWMLDFYKEWHLYIESNFPCCLANDHIIVYDLRTQEMQKA